MVGFLPKSVKKIHAKRLQGEWFQDGVVNLLIEPRGILNPLKRFRGKVALLYGLRFRVRSVRNPMVAFPIIILLRSANVSVCRFSVVPTQSICSNKTFWTRHTLQEAGSVSSCGKMGSSYSYSYSYPAFGSRSPGTEDRDLRWVRKVVLKKSYYLILSVCCTIDVLLLLQYSS